MKPAEAAKASRPCGIHAGMPEAALSARAVRSDAGKCSVVRMLLTEVPVSHPLASAAPVAAEISLLGTIETAAGRIA